MDSASAHASFGEDALARRLAAQLRRPRLWADVVAPSSSCEAASSLAGACPPHAFLLTRLLAGGASPAANAGTATLPQALCGGGLQESCWHLVSGPPADRGCPPCVDGGVSRSSTPRRSQARGSGTARGPGALRGIALGNFMTSPRFLAESLRPALATAADGAAARSVPVVFLGDAPRDRGERGLAEAQELARCIEEVSPAAAASPSGRAGAAAAGRVASVTVAWFERNAEAAGPDFRVNHAKWAVLCWERCSRVVVFTANFIPIDWDSKTQAVWWADVPRSGWVRESRTAGAQKCAARAGPGTAPLEAAPADPPRRPGLPAGDFQESLRAFLERLSRVCKARGALEWLRGPSLCRNPGFGTRPSAAAPSTRGPVDGAKGSDPARQGARTPEFHVPPAASLSPSAEASPANRPRDAEPVGCSSSSSSWARAHRLDSGSEEAAIRARGGMLADYDWTGVRPVLVSTAPGLRGTSATSASGRPHSSAASLAQHLQHEPMPLAYAGPGPGGASGSGQVAPLVLQFSSVGAVLNDVDARGQGCIAAERGRGGRLLSALSRLGPCPEHPPPAANRAGSEAQASGQLLRPPPPRGSSAIWTVGHRAGLAAAPAAAARGATASMRQTTLGGARRALLAPVFVVYPSMGQVRGSFEGLPEGGCSMPSAAKRWLRYRGEGVQPQRIMQAWRLWGGGSYQREQAMPHCKMFFRFAEQTAPAGAEGARAGRRPARLLWLMLGSQNMSSLAWAPDGLQDTKDGVVARPIGAAHFELGVLFLPSRFREARDSPLPSFVPLHPPADSHGGLGGTDLLGGEGQALGFPIPFPLPPATPVNSDIPWCTAGPDDCASLRRAVEVAASGDACATAASPVDLT